MTEFELIARYFTRLPTPGGLVARGVGDDCALLLGERCLAVTTDLLVEGRHFFPATDPEALGHKALAVNLSDLAAAGAVPRCFFLALALPRADEAWLAAFARGLLALADRHDCVLAGGDTTRAPQAGPLTICITAIGEVPPGAALNRAGARPGDELWVSGTVGDAALALALRDGQLAPLQADTAESVRERLDRPQPRIALGLALRGVASSCVDVSDGLLGDLGHILDRSRIGAELDWEQLPRSAALRAQPPSLQQRCALAGGDDYELLFTAPLAKRLAVEAAGAAAEVELTCIGRVNAEPGCRVRDAQGRMLDTAALKSFDHFA